MLQSHCFDRVPTVIVAPLLVDDARSAYSEASVKVAFLGNPYVASIPELAGIDASSLRKSLGDLRDYEYELRRALDLLFTGF